VIDCNEKPVALHSLAHGRDQVGVLREPCLIRQIVTEIALIENDARGPEIAEQSPVLGAERCGRTQTDDEVIAYACEVGMGHERFFSGSEQ
jgi:hypothetical protein